jgi:two-component system sensor histidine kinase MtrB
LRAPGTPPDASGAAEVLASESGDGDPGVPGSARAESDVRGQPGRPEEPRNGEPPRNGEHRRADGPVGAQGANRRPRVIRPRRRRHLGLRARVTTTFALGALVMSGALASITYISVRNSVLNQQEVALRQEALGSAVLMSGKLQHPSSDYDQLLASVDPAGGSQSFLYQQSEWYVSAPTLPPDVLPKALRSTVLSGHPAQQVFLLGGSPHLVVGVPVKLAKADYFEIFDLSNISRTLHVLLVSLILAAAVTTLGGAVLGSWGASRSLRPLHEAAQAALAIAGGRLDTRLESESYADLAVLTSAFNRMADRLQERIEREVRFTSDVNHELRSPLTTLTASLAVLEGRRDELPDRSQRALDLLGAEVRRFRRLVDDLLEISRLDAGLSEVSHDEVDLGSLVHRSVEATGIAVMVDIDETTARRRVVTDKVRFERIMANLLQNARHYAGGPTRVAVETHGGIGRFVVEDRGPGVPLAERDRIFDRFSRGSSAKRRGAGEGTGLGLAIVSEHARALGGRVWVEDNGSRGARFVVELPILPGGSDEEALA